MAVEDSAPPRPTVDLVTAHSNTDKNNTKMKHFEPFHFHKFDLSKKLQTAHN